MPPNPGERPAGERQPPGAGEPAGGRFAHKGRPERYGAVVLERRVKDDGRALILYSHYESEPP